MSEILLGRSLLPASPRYRCIKICDGYSVDAYEVIIDLVGYPRLGRKLWTARRRAS